MENNQPKEPSRSAGVASSSYVNIINNGGNQVLTGFNSNKCGTQIVGGVDMATRNVDEMSKRNVAQRHPYIERDVVMAASISDIGGRTGSCLGPCLWDQVKNAYSSIKNFEENVKTLEVEFAHLNTKMVDTLDRVNLGESSNQKITSETKLWLELGNELVTKDEELKKLLDENEREIKDQCCFNCFGCNLYWRYKMSELSKSKIVKIHNICSKQPQTSVTTPIPFSDFQWTTTSQSFGLTSRKELLGKILKKLRDDEVDMVGIWGMGAIGKTTLAGEIESCLKGEFDEVVMVEISQNANILSSQTKISEKIDLPLQDKQDLDVRKKNIFERLRKKRKGNEDKKRKTILMILDNIWDEVQLEELGIPFRRTPMVSCKILVTCRDKNCCEFMGIDPVNTFKIEVLGTHESSVLFQEQVDEETRRLLKEDDTYKSLEKRLLKRCGGIPLAIITLAKTLRYKKLKDWRLYAKELEQPFYSQVSNVYDQVFKVLQTSYEFIENTEKKKFFLLACLYPIGLSIPIHDIMRYGFAWGLFKKDSLIEAEEIATKWSNDLISSSLLLMGDYEDHLRVHDVVREFGILYAKKDNHKFMVEPNPESYVEEESNVVTAISLRYGHDHNCLGRVNCSMLQILLLVGSRPQHFPENFFQRMTRIRLLVLSGMNFEEKLPESLKMLHNLKTLHLESCELGDTGLVGELVSLRVLSFRDSIIEQLSEQMKYLKELLLLDLTKCESLETIPANILCHLSNLEQLYMSNSFNGWQKQENRIGDFGIMANTKELMKLHNLKALELNISSIEQWPNEDEQVKNLVKFNITIGKSFSYKYSMREHLENNCVLAIEDVDLSSLTTYDGLMTLLKKANSLFLKSINGLHNFVHDLLGDGGFPHLKHLKIKNCFQMDTLSKSWIASGSRTSQWVFSNLQELSLVNLCNLQSYALPINLAQNLIRVKASGCDMLEFLFLEVEDMRRNETTIAALPCLKSLYLKNLAKFKSMLGEEKFLSTNAVNNIVQQESQFLFSAKVQCESLEELYIEELECIKSLWDLSKYSDTLTSQSLTNEDHEGSSSIQRSIDDSHIQDSLHKFDCSSFQYLKDITIAKCRALESVGPLSVVVTLMHLERLSIASCEKISEVVTAGTHEKENPSKIHKFSKLKKLILRNLPSLKWFYGGDYVLQFPTLSALDLCELPKMSTFVGFSRTKDSMAMFNERVHFPSLEELNIFGCGCIKKVWDENMKASSNLEATQWGTSQDDQQYSSCLQEEGLFHDISSNNHYSNFGDLRYLDVGKCGSLESLGPPSMVASLVNLQELEIKNCEMEEIIITKPYDEQENGLSNKVVIEIPKLKKLGLLRLESLQWVNEGGYHLQFPSLTCLTLFDLSNTTISIVLSEKVLNGMQMLEELLIHSCSEWEGDMIENESSSNIREGEVGIDHTTSTKWSLSSFCRQLKVLRLTYLPKMKVVPNLHLVFENLHELILYRLDKWKYVLSGEMVRKRCNAHNKITLFPHLKKLVIERCREMEGVIMMGDETPQQQYDPSTLTPPHHHHTPSTSSHVAAAAAAGSSSLSSSSSPIIIIEFPQLQSISLGRMKKLHYFCGAPQFSFHFPTLTHLHLWRVKEMESFCVGGGVGPNKTPPMLAPKLTTISFYKDPYPVKPNDDINDIIKNHYGGNNNRRANLYDDKNDVEEAVNVEKCKLHNICDIYLPPGSSHAQKNILVE